MVEALSFRRDAHRRGGFTLIEVVIALAIFVFGALAIIRIFPPALGVIQNSGDRLTAVNLNRSVLAVYARQPGLVPDGIYDARSGLLGYGLTWDDRRVGSVAGPPRRNNSIPYAAINNIDDQYNLSALGHYKNISGERHVIPRDGIVLTQHRFTGTPLIYQEDTVSGVTVDAMGNLDFTGSTKDSDSSVYFSATVGNRTPPASDNVYVSYQYLSGGRIWGVDEEPIVKPTPPTPMVAYKVSHPTPIAGSVRVKIRQPVALRPTHVSDARYGLLDLNGATDVVNTTLAIVPGKTVSVDYLVEDWRWLVFDGIPTDNPRNNSAIGTQKSLNLPVKILDDQKSPSFIYTSLRSANRAPDNRESAAPGGSLPPVNFLPPDARETRNGRVVFETNAFAGETPQARVVYWTSDNWASQLSVAARSYLLRDNIQGASGEYWRDCSFDTGEAARNNLYFKPSEAGKTLLVSYSYLDANGIERDIDGRIITIDNTIKGSTGGMPTHLAEGGQVSRAELTGINGDSLENTLPNPSRVIAIREIRGVSIQARTAWLDGNNFTQASSVGFREVNN